MAATDWQDLTHLKPGENVVRVLPKRPGRFDFNETLPGEPRPPRRLPRTRRERKARNAALARRADRAGVTVPDLLRAREAAAILSPRLTYGTPRWVGLDPGASPSVSVSFVADPSDPNCRFKLVGTVSGRTSSSGPNRSNVAREP